MSNFSPAAVIVHPSGTNNVGYEKEFPLWVTGSTGLTQITGSVEIKNPIINITGSVNIPTVISASVVNFPAVQEITGTVAIVQPVTVNGTVTSIITGTVDVAVTNFPATQTITGSVNVTNAVFPVTGTIKADITGTVNVAVLSQPNITGSVNVTNSIFPVTGNVGISQPVTASITNFPAVQTITGTVALTAQPIQITSTGSLPVVVMSLPNITGSVNVTNSVFPVTGTIKADITGTVNVNVLTQPDITGSVHVTNAVLNVTGTLGVDNVVRVTTTGSLPVSVQAPLPSGSNSIGSIFADLRISGSIVTTSNPVPVTGSVAILNQIFVTTTGSLPVSGTVTVQGMANSGSTALGNPVLIAGVSGSTVRVPAVVDKEPVASLHAMVTRDLGVTRPSFFAVYDRIAPAANKYMATIFNTSSTKKVVIQRVWVFNWQEATVNGALLSQEFRKITARTAGTSVTPSAEDTLDILPAGITADHNSSAVSDSDLIKRLWAAGEEVFLSSAAFLLGGRAIDANCLMYERKDGMRGLTLRQNQGVTIKNITSSTVGTVSYVIEFTVEDA